MLFVRALGLLAVLAGAQNTPSFEDQLARVHAAVFRALDDQRAASVDDAARRTQALDGQAGQARWRLQDIRRRAAWIQPGAGHDWFFEADLSALRGDLAELAARARELERAVAQLAKDTPADASLAPAAARLSVAARGLRLECGRLADDARWTSHELRRAGFPAEGTDVQASSTAALMSAFHVEEAASRLKRKCER